MKGVVYFNQDTKTSIDGIYNAGIIWPLFYLIIKMWCKNNWMSLWISFNISCLVSLFQFESVLSAMVWYSGVFVALFGMYGNINIKFALSVFLSVCISIMYYYIRVEIEGDGKNEHDIVPTLPFVLPYIVFTIIVMFVPEKRYVIPIFLCIQCIVCIVLKIEKK